MVVGMVVVEDEEAFTPLFTKWAGLGGDWANEEAMEEEEEAEGGVSTVEEVWK